MIKTVDDDYELAKKLLVMTSDARALLRQASECIREVPIEYLENDAAVTALLDVAERTVTHLEAVLTDEIPLEARKLLN